MITLKDIENTCIEIDSFLKTSPGYNDIDLCDYFFQEIRSYHSTLAHYIGVLEAMNAVALGKVIENCPEELYKRIKNSSTVLTKYAESKNPELSKLYHWCRQLDYVIRSTMDTMRTMISFRKTEIETGLKTIKNVS